MNKKKQEVEKRKILNLFNYNSLSGSRMNCFKISSHESDMHIKKKFALFYRLIKSKYEVWTEVKFKNGRKADIVSIKKGVATGYEILASETVRQCEKKLESYPNEIEWVIIGSFEEIYKLEF